MNILPTFVTSFKTLDEIESRNPGALKILGSKLFAKNFPVPIALAQETES